MELCLSLFTTKYTLKNLLLNDNFFLLCTQYQVRIKSFILVTFSIYRIGNLTFLSYTLHKMLQI